MLKKFFIFLNILALTLLLLSCMAAYVNPNSFWQLSFIGFAFPVVMLINVVFLIGWALMRSRLAFVSLVAILLCWKFIWSSFAFNFFSEQMEEGVKVMSWNVKNFDLYNWSGNEETREQMMSLIESESPDVLCMQEYYSNNQKFHNTEYLRDTLGYKYCYFPPSVQLKNPPKSKIQKKLWGSWPHVQQWGVAIFSKYPFSDTGRIDFSNSLTNDCIYADILMPAPKGNTKTVRVYNTHFQSIHLGNDDYSTIDDIEVKQETSWLKLKNILRKMKRAYAQRAEQANTVAVHMADYTGSKLLCGDFNDIPVSYTYKTVRGPMQDAFSEKGRGFEATYVNKLSIFRIDYVFCSPEVTVNSYATIRKKHSDHYPVMVRVGL